jgi:uncharacterized metal-binding protein YceD (DUF177 family)
MRVKLGEISERGLDFHAGLEDDWARTAARVALEGEVQELRLDARIQLVADCVRVQGKLHAEVHRDCDRCQVSLKLEVSGETNLYYSPPRPGDVGDRDLDPGDMDIGWFDGNGLEMAQVIGEQLAIWCPDPVYCESEETTRLEASDAPCEVPEHDGGPELKRHSPFADLRLPE